MNGRWHPLPEKPLPSAFDNAKLDGSYTGHISRLPPWHLAVMSLLGKRCSCLATTTGLASAEEFEQLGSITGTNLGSYMEVRKTLEAFLGERKERVYIPFTDKTGKARNKFLRSVDRMLVKAAQTVATR